MEQEPTSAPFDDTVMGGPTYYRLQQFATETEGPIRRMTGSIAEEVAVARAVAEIVDSIAFVHPRGFEETMGIVGTQRLSVVVHDDYGPRLLGKLSDVSRHASYTGWQGWLGALRQMSILECTIVTITLKLSTPDAAEIDVNLAIFVLESTRIDGIAAANGIGKWRERTFGTLCNGYAKMEDIRAILHAINKIVSAILLDYIVVPQLTTSPRDVVHVKNLAQITSLKLIGVIKTEDVVVLHIEMIAIVVLGYAALTVMRGIDVKAVAKDVA